MSPFASFVDAHSDALENCDESAICPGFVDVSDMMSFRIDLLHPDLPTMLSISRRFLMSDLS